MPRNVDVSVSVTELPQFRRLVQFVSEVEEYAEFRQDEELDALAQAAKADLLEMAS